MNAGVGLRVADFVGGYLIDAVQRVTEGAARVAAHALRVAKIKDRLSLGAEGDAGIFVGKKTAAPQFWSDGLQVRAGKRQRVEHDKRGEIFVHAAKAVGDP